MIAVLLFCVACAVYWLWSWKNEKSTEPPCLPGAWPVLGHIPRLLEKTDTCSLVDVIDEVATHCTKMGGVVSGKIGPVTHYVITDPDDLLTVATTSMEKDSYYRFAEPWLGDGLVFAKCPIWKAHRKLLNPAFSQSLLDTFIGVFNSQSRKLLTVFDKEVGQGPFYHWLSIRHNALETICKTALGVDFSDPNLKNDYFEASDTMFDIHVERFLKFWWHFDCTFAWSRLKKKQDAVLKILHKMSNTVLQKRKSNFYENNALTESNYGKSGSSNFRPFIDILLELSIEKGAFTDKQIRNHVDTMLVAGQDTSTTVLVFTTMLLGSYPEAQEKMFTELQEVLGGDRDVEKADLSKLVYMEAFLKESMRLYSIAPFVGRTMETDVKLRNYTLSAGRTAWLLYYGVHRHPIWGPDAQEFDPERWLEPGRLPENPGAYAAFSLGKRNCIGKAYAMMSMKTTLAHMVRRYRIKSDITKMRIKMEIMLKPHSGHCISLEKRT